MNCVEKMFWGGEVRSPGPKIMLISDELVTAGQGCLLGSALVKLHEGVIGMNLH